jgi:hypothetical protein
LHIKRGWQENRLERPMRIGVGKVSLLKFTFTLNVLITSVSFLLLQLLIFKVTYEHFNFKITVKRVN